MEPVNPAASAATILVVEDHPLNLRLVRDILEYRGHRVESAGTVDEALAALAAGRPNLVLLDIQIPGGGGELVLATLREDPRLVGLPVIAVTAQAMSGDRERFLRQGFDGYISKPIDTRSFASTVESYLSRSDSHGPPVR